MKAEPSPKRVAVIGPAPEARESLGKILRLREQPVEAECAGVAGHAIERGLALGRALQRGHRAVARRRHQARRLALVHDLEMRRDVRLERE